MSKYWIFGLVLVLLASMVIAMPSAIDTTSTYNSTLNGSAVNVQVTWQTDDAQTLSFFIISTNNSGTWANKSVLAFEANISSPVANISADAFTLNATPSTIHWKVYANDSNNSWSVSMSYSLTTYAAHEDYYKTGSCPITDTPSTLMYIFIGVMILGIFILGNTLFQQLPIFSLAPALAMIFYSFPMYGCHLVYGAMLTIFGIVMLIWSWQKATEQLRWSL